MPNRKIKKHEITRKILAGIFFICGIWLTTTVILTIGKDKGLAQPKFNITVYYHDVGGLIEGAPVRLAGVNVGSVSTINFLEKEEDGRRVVVVLNIFEKFRKQLQKNATFAIKTEGILGEKLIEISILSDGKKLDIDHPIMGMDPIDVQDMAEVFAEAAESFTETSDALSKIDIQGLSNSLDDAAQSLSTTSTGINTVLKELQYVTKKSRRLLNRIEERIIDGTLFKVF